MIASIRGTLIAKEPGTCVIEAAGVGYLLQISSNTAKTLPESGKEVFLRTRQVVREDALTLFGFSDVDELKLFDLLIGVSGVGPRVALALLSGLRPDVLTRAIRDEQIAALTTVPGVGRKTAERLVVELRDKVDAPKLGGRGPGVLPKSEHFQDAVAALVRLGYTSIQSQVAVRQVYEEDRDASLEDMVRKSLALLGKTPASAASTASGRTRASREGR